MSKEIKRNTAIVDPSFLVFLGIAGIAGFLCYLRGEDVFFKGLAVSAEILIQVLPKITGAFLMAAFVQVLIPREMVTRWIGDESGLKGIMIAIVVGVFTPGGPMTSFPLIAALASMGANIGSLIAYLLSWELMGMQRILIWELPLMGMRFTLLRFFISLLFPLIAGVVAQKLAAGFPGPGTKED